MSYCGYITRLKSVKKHSNADKLQIAEVFGNPVVIGSDMNEGDLVFYLPTDGKVSEEYAVENKLTRSMGGYLDDSKLHITTIRLRGERSDGLIMPIESLSKFTNINDLKEGDTISVLNGVVICEKYIPKGKVRNSQPTQKQVGKKKEKKESFPFFQQHIDTAQLPYNLGQFKEGDTVYISLKLHGTSQRTAHTIKQKQSLFRKVVKVLFGTDGLSKLPKRWEYITGTRRVTLDSFDGGFYGSNEFRKQWHDFFIGKLHKGEEVYYELVGYMKDDQTIMPECDNKKTKDKQFIKEYGDKTRFTYGCGTGQNDIYVYRMTMTNEDGHVVEYPTELVQLRCEQMGVKFAPILDKFIFTTREDLLERVKKYEDGADPIGKTHVREGVIVRIDNREKFTALKQKNFHFKVLEGIIKSDDVIDMEEENSEQVQ